MKDNEYITYEKEGEKWVRKIKCKDDVCSECGELYNSEYHISDECVGESIHE